jgi:hypothetical protein
MTTELQDLNWPSSIAGMIKLMTVRWVGHVARMREKENACRILAGKPEGKTLLTRRRRKRENYTTMEFKVNDLRV